MPRPVFGAVDWWTFEELEDAQRFPTTFEQRKRCHDAGFETAVQWAADELARAGFGDDADGTDPVEGPFYATWPDLEFCVSRGTKTLLMVRRRTKD